MAGKIKNIAASVHQRLLNKAKESSRPFNEILQHFAIEKFIYRLSKTPFVSKPSIFNPTFMKDDTKQAQWQGFIKKTKLTDAPASFEDVAVGINIFLQPVVVSIIDRQTFRLFWAAPGPWYI